MKNVLCLFLLFVSLSQLCLCFQPCPFNSIGLPLSVSFSHLLLTSSQNTAVNTGVQDGGDVGDTEESNLRLLPPASENKNGTTSIKLGESTSMEELGPIIINADGTTRRITNWDILTKQEKESSWRIIAARNKKRLAILKARQSDSKEEGA